MIVWVVWQVPHSMPDATTGSTVAVGWLFA